MPSPEPAPVPSDLERLLEAASPDPTTCNCGSVSTYHHPVCTRHRAREKELDARCTLRALAPGMARELIGRRSAGQALAKFLQQRVNEQSGHFADCPASEEIIHWGEAKPGSCCCADDLKALDDWNALGQEGSDG